MRLHGWIRGEISWNLTVNWHVFVTLTLGNLNDSLCNIPRIYHGIFPQFSCPPLDHRVLGTLSWPPFVGRVSPPPLLGGWASLNIGGLLWFQWPCVHHDGRPLGLLPGGRKFKRRPKHSIVALCYILGVVGAAGGLTGNCTRKFRLLLVSYMRSTIGHFNKIYYIYR